MMLKTTKKSSLTITCSAIDDDDVNAGVDDSDNDKDDSYPDDFFIAYLF